MKNLDDAVGTFFTNNHRYIKLDGSGFYSGKLKSIFERANFNAGAMAVIALSAVDYFSQTDLTTITPQTYNNLIQNGGIFAGLVVFAQRGELFDAIWPERRKRRLAHKFFTKAIDTTGRSLSRAELSIKDIAILNGGRSAGTLGPMLFLPFAHLVLSNIYGLEGAVIHTTMVSAAGIAMSNRFNKLIRGHLGIDDGYVFMDEPPAKEVKAKTPQLSFGGLTNPTP
jgi:hypothetical protein